MRTQSCHGRVTGIVVGCTALVLALTGAATAQAAPHHDPARAVLAANDGWAAEGAGTTGGSTATGDHVYTVSTRAELIAAFADAGSAPKIIKVKGTLDFNADDAGNEQTCADYAAPGYDFTQYLADYDPAVWGYDTNLDQEPATSQEGLRRASAAAQGARVQVQVPANTTIVGIGKNPKILSGDLQIKGVDNVIVRNLTFEDAFDCFPQWDPTDGDTGNWNSEYDNLVVYGSTHVWIDHNTFTDGRRPDSAQPFYYGRIYQQHDGELDVVKGANYVTASWNAFTDHDKTLLFGNSDSASATDAGKLKVTLHHNLFKGITERAPRVRFGQVDTYNNHFVVTADQEYTYSIGVGVNSQIVAEANAFTLPAGIGADRVLYKWKGAGLTAAGNYVNGRATDVLAAYNTANPTALLGGDAGWVPALRTKVDSAKNVPCTVDREAGAGKLR
ncbi:pectate lyase family protein [Streptomyces sp. NBC_01465]|uniref:pectate lyase family protein n=1 Tax=Streptomyces sp. NBC_01465 TaxID=2903878 RepID=UPI002E34A9AA|nr:pectate lyase [Streptomyces sp. NBC_01465]